MEASRKLQICPTRDLRSNFRCSTLLQKLDVLMQSLSSEEERVEESGFEPEDDEREFEYG